MAHAATSAEMELLIQTTIQEEGAIPVEAGVKNAAGKYNGLMRPRTYTVKHPAAPQLAKCALDRCPVDCGRTGHMTTLKQPSYTDHTNQPAQWKQSPHCMAKQRKRLPMGLQRWYKTETSGQTDPSNS
eukprot:3154752-Ditylum_brightwellii.AAC.1